MKQIIEGKTYNTETAELIGKYESGHYRGDFRKKTEWLYKTAKGNFFMHGIGGFMTEYSSPRLIPMSEQDAFDWAQLHMETETIENYFSHLLEEA